MDIMKTAINEKKLSICIATYNRGNYIGGTLDTIISQMDSKVELIVVDGASPDNTLDIMTEYIYRYPEIRYYREPVNSGVDADYDKAVSYAIGEYCWLMTDDDLLRTGAVKQVLQSIENSPELVVVNSEVKNLNFSKLYLERSLALYQDRKYGENEGEKFFSEMANYLSFIGAVVVKRQTWLERNRTDYFGTLFVHVGVIFQSPPIKKVNVIAEPLITIRYGNGMWSSRSFEIWTFKWPKLIWSFVDFSDKAKLEVTPREPRRRLSRLFRNRALGTFNYAQVKQYWPSNVKKMECITLAIISIFPASLANCISVFYLAISRSPNYSAIHDLLHSKYAAFPSQYIARFFNIDIHKN